MARCLRRQGTTCAALADYLSPLVLERMLVDCARYTRQQLDYLFTITSIIEDLTPGTTTLEQPF